MSARSFRSVFMVASCAGAALGCYLVSLRVASERAALEEVETRIVLAQRDIRLLQTEIGTRGRLAQLERWNAKVIALSAPTADQFLKGGFELARLTTPEDRPAIEAPVVLAAAPAAMAPHAEQQRQAGGAGPAAMMHEASLKTLPRADERLAPRAPAEAHAKQPRTQPKATDTRSAPKTTAKAEPAQTSPKTAQPKPKAEPSNGKAAQSAAAKPAKTAARDPLAPLPEKTTRVAAKSPAKSTRETTKKQ